MTRQPSPASVGERAFPWLLLVGLMLVAVNLRGPIVAIAPVITEIEADLGLSPTTAGLLTSLPVLCFALATPLAAWTIRLTGAERAVAVSLVGVLAGTVIRSTGSVTAAFVGTVVIGVAITIGNVVVPVVIRRDVPASRAQLATGVYTAMLNVGSMLTAALTAPLADAIGWQLATLTWAIPVVAALAVWGVHLRRVTVESRERRLADARAVTGAITAIDPVRGAWSNSMTWILAAAFSMQAFSYYAVTAWLPTLLADEHGLDLVRSGGVASIFQIAAVIGALGVPLLARVGPASFQAIVVGVLWVTLPAGLLIAPEAYPLWAFLGGIAQGGGFVVIISVIVRIARSDREATQMSALVQAGGYLVAACGPPLLGAIHESTGEWTAPMLTVLASTLAFLVLATVATTLASRDRRTGHPTSGP